MGSVVNGGLLFYVYLLLIALSVVFLLSRLPSMFNYWQRRRAEEEIQAARVQEAQAQARRAEEEAINAQLGVPSSGASVPMMITIAMEVRLRARGYTDAQIHRMKPAEAHQILESTR